LFVRNDSTGGWPTADACIGVGAWGASASPRKLLGEQVIHPAAPIFSVLFQIFWATSHKSSGKSSVLPLGHPVPQFDVSFPEKLLKMVTTRGEVFSLSFKYHLAAWLRPDLLGKLKCSPDFSRNRGAYF